MYTEYAKLLITRVHFTLRYFIIRLGMKQDERIIEMYTADIDQVPKLETYKIEKKFLIFRYCWNHVTLFIED